MSLEATWGADGEHRLPDTPSESESLVWGPKCLHYCRFSQMNYMYVATVETLTAAEREILKILFVCCPVSSVNVHEYVHVTFCLSWER